MSNEFKKGEVFIYCNGDKMQLGVVKRKNPKMKDCYFCYYHCGDTAANTHVSNMHKIDNAYAFKIERISLDKLL